MSDQTPTPETDTTADVEGHMPYLRKIDGDDVEGHGFSKRAVDDVTGDDGQEPGIRVKF